MLRQQCAGCDAWFTGEGHWCPKCKLELDEVKDNAKARTLLNVISCGKRSDCADTASADSNAEPVTTDEV